MSITIRKALEILQDDLKSNRGKISPDLEDARTLALEALEEITYLRAALMFCQAPFLKTELPEEFVETPEMYPGQTKTPTP